MSKEAALQKPNKIICVHTINDFGGTSLIMSEIIQGLLEKGYTVELFVRGAKNNGFLSKLPVRTHSYFYRETNSSFLTIMYFLLSQLQLFFTIVNHCWKKEVGLYINTLKPAGAGLAGKLCKRRVIYHIHEISIIPKIIDTICQKVAQHSANDLIYVSNFILKKKKIDGPRKHVVHNALSPQFVSRTIANVEKDQFTILMLCNLKIYKGVIEFVHLARRLPQYRFELVLNASEDEINAFFKKIRFSENLIVHSSQPNVHRFYARASLVVNLSHPDKWLESFGMTILEAMHYGLPVIVPPIGGISELVVENYNGFHISYNDTDKLIATIIKIAENPDLYLRLSAGAKEMVKKFDYQTMIENIVSILELKGDQK